MEKIYGVIDVTSGYANGKTRNPKYQDLHSSGHAETVHVIYDASKVNLSTLLKYYFKIIDPISVNKQGNNFFISAFSKCPGRTFSAFPSLFTTTEVG